MANAGQFASGSAHPRWNGGRRHAVNGYVFVLAHGHPKADRAGYVLEHVLIVERALGKFLPDGAQVHHVDQRKDHNENSNLVACQDQAYHALLHQRQRAMDACGNPNWRLCSYCGRHDDPSRLRNHGTAFSHDDCHNSYRRTRRQRGN